MKIFKLINNFLNEKKQSFRINEPVDVPIEQFKNTLKEISRIQKFIREISIIDLRKLEKPFH
jgi:hypothetical protein